MIGIIPSGKNTFEVEGDFSSTDLIEGHLYYHPDSQMLYYHSTTEARPNPRTGFFPVWDGKTTYVSSFALEKYLYRDVKKVDLDTMNSQLNKTVADDILYKMRRCENDQILNPQIADEDNSFTQCIKGIISQKQLTIVDLCDMAAPKISEHVVENYYNALLRITFMRLDKWNIWIDSILHLWYTVTVYKDDTALAVYDYRSNKFNVTGYDDITNSKDDAFKKLIKIVMRMQNITKVSLRSDEVDDYTINNMMTTINSKKALSAQLFSRFMRMASLSYEISIYEGDDKIFEYKE